MLTTWFEVFTSVCSAFSNYRCVYNDPMAETLLKPLNKIYFVKCF